MRKLKTVKMLVLALTALAAIALLFAQVQAQPAPVPKAMPQAKVAVCDIVKIFANYQKAKDIEAKLREARRTVDAEDEKRKTKITAMENELMEGLDPASKEYETRLAELTRLNIERETWLKFEEKRQGMDRYRLTELMYKEVLKAVAGVAKDQDVQLVLSSDDTVPGRLDAYRQVENKKVLYSDGALDITDTVVGRLNDQYKASTKGPME